MEQPNRVYIVEDMALSRFNLERKLRKNGFEVTGSSASAEDAWKELKNITDLDVVLIDIHLAGEKDGIWLAKQIRTHLSMAIIYLTAFGDDKTLSEIEATKPNGYLMKPYNTPTLLTTIRIALESYKKQVDLVRNSLESDSTIYINEGHKRSKLNMADILYVQSDGNYLYVVCSEKRHIIRSKLTSFQEELSSPLFYRTHLRYLVNIKRIDHIGSDHLVVGDQKIPLAKKHKSGLLELMGVE